MTEENMIKKYGEEEGRKRWNKYKDIQAYTNTFKYKKEKYGWDKKRFDEYNANRAQTLENYIKRHGKIEGTKKWNEYVETQRDVGCSKKYFIEKYGKVDGLNIYIELNKRKAQTVENFILRYGDETIGLKKYIKYINGKTNTSYSGSRISNEMFVSIANKLVDLNYSEIYTMNFSKEWFIYEKGMNNIIFVDFFLKEEGKIIEFFGDYWHGNPIKYLPNTIILYPNNNKVIVNDIWKRDKERIDLLNSMPYVKDVKIVWEFDYINNKEKTIEECMNFLLQK